MIKTLCCLSKGILRKLSSGFRLSSVLILILSGLVSGQQTQAQLVSSYYSWSQSSQTYVPGVSTTSTVPANVFPVSWDDQTTVYPLPFNFTYRGTLYTTAGTIGVDADAWAAFSTGTIAMTGNLGGGSWISATNHTGMYLNGNANNNGFAGFNSDIYEQTYPAITGNTTNGSPVITAISDLSNVRVGIRLTGSGIPVGTVVTSINTATSSITLSGNATITASGVSIISRSSIYAFLRGIFPYRQFVIQWTRATRFSGPGDDFSFQLVINEGGGNPNYQTLQAVYGICKAASTAASPQSAQVGLRGATNADFNARKTSTNWSATTAATLNTDVCTVTPAVDPPTGLTFTWSPACLAVPGNAGAVSGPLNVCPNSIIDYSIPGVPGAIRYDWTYTGGGTTLSGSSTLPLNTLNFGPLATGGTLTVTPYNLCGTGLSSSITITMSAAPTATISYPSPSYCTSAAAVSVTQTGTSGGTYSVTPAGLTINGATGQVIPSSSTPGSYLVTYTFTSGCTATATANIAINAGPTATATATPALICTGANSQLSVAAGGGTYSVSSIAYASVAPSGSPVNIFNSFEDETISPSIPMPIPFTFYGQNITDFNVSSNGYIQLGPGTPVNVFTPQTLPTAVDPNNVVALSWSDLLVDPAVNAGANVRYYVNGTSPNQVLIIDFVKLSFYPSSVGNVTGQIRLYQSDNHIEVAVFRVNDGSLSKKKTLGIENLAGTVGLTPAGRNNVVWNATISEAWSFYPTIFTYLWSPAGSITSGQTTIANPTTTALAATTPFNVVVTNTSTGCAVNTPVTVTIGAPLNGTYTVGVGGNYTTLTAAVNAYNSLCIGGPVIFSLIDATYPGETFPISINSNVYQNAVNTLKIKPATGVNATISGSLASNALIRISGRYISVDGSNVANGITRNLTITNTNTSTPYVVLFGSIGTTAVSNSSLKNCTIINGSNLSSAVILSNAAAPGTAGYFSNDSIQNNVIRKAYMGIYAIGVNTGTNGNGLQILSNDLTSTGTDAIYITGIYAQDITGVNIQYNQVGNLAGLDAYDDKGIWLATGVRNSNVLNNRIFNLNYLGTGGYGGHGIYVSTSVVNANISVINNMIANISGDGYDYTAGTLGFDNPSGILLYTATTQSGIKVYHNSINLYGETLNKLRAISTGIRLSAGSTADIRNNIIVNNLGRVAANTTAHGTIGILAASVSTQFSNLDFNDYVINPTGTIPKYFGQIAATGQTTLPGWRIATGRDAASINVAPTFATAIDLHLSPAASNILINETGSPLTGPTIDYDTTTRNGLKPDIGADEFLAPNTGSWVGKTSIDWLVNTNWETNTIPTLTTDVTISGGYSFLPTIITTQAVRGLNLITNNPVLTLNNGTLQVYGPIVRSSGNINGVNGTLEMNGAAAQTIPASLFISNNLKNLVIGNTNATGVSIGGVLDIYRSVTFSALGLKLNTNNFLKFKSTATETAWLGNVTGKTITGNATIERYIPTGINHGKSWQLLAAPVRGFQSVKASWQENNVPLFIGTPGYGTTLSSEKVGAFSRGYDFFTAPGPSIKTYDALTGTYTSIDDGIASTSAVNISNQKGYMVLIRGDRSVQAFNATAIPTTLRTTGGLYTASAGELPPATTVLPNKFATIGNPYPSAVNFASLTRAPGVDDVFYLWDPLLQGSNLLGGYQTVTGITGYLPTPGSPNYPSGTAVTGIQSGQAFFVHGTAGGNVSFSEAAKLSGSQLVLRPEAANTLQMLRADLYKVSSASLGKVDGNLIVFDKHFDNAFTKDDAPKLFNTGENIGVNSNARILAVEARKPVVSQDTIFYQLGNLRFEAYEFRFAPLNLRSLNLTAYLVDRFLNTRTPVSLTDSTFINFSISSTPGSAASDRFYLVFKSINPVPGTLSRNSTGAVNAKGLSANDLNPGISVYPNPVENKMLTISFSNQLAGEYKIWLNNKLGQLIYSNKIYVDNNVEIKILTLGETIASGSYQLTIIAPGDKKIVSQVIVQ